MATKKNRTVTRESGSNMLPHVRTNLRDALTSAVNGDTKLTVYLVMTIAALVMSGNSTINRAWALEMVTDDRAAAEKRNAAIWGECFERAKDDKGRYIRTIDEQKKVNITAVRVAPFVATVARMNALGDLSITDDGKYLIVPGLLLGSNRPTITLDGAKVTLLPTKSAEGEQLAPEPVVHKKANGKGDRVIVKATMTDVVLYNAPAGTRVDGRNATKGTTAATTGGTKGKGTTTTTTTVPLDMQRTAAPPTAIPSLANELDKTLAKLSEDKAELTDTAKQYLARLLYRASLVLGGTRAVVNIITTEAEMRQTATKVRAQVARTRKAKAPPVTSTEVNETPAETNAAAA